MSPALDAPYLLMLACSPRPDGSVSRHMGRLLAAAWLERQPALQRRQRDPLAQAAQLTHAWIDRHLAEAAS